MAQAGDLSHRYGRHDALIDVTFSLAPGVTGLVGVNGAGKSTLLRLLSTTLLPRSGSLTLFGSDPAHQLADVRRRIGYMPQSLDIPGGLGVRDFLAYMAWLRGYGRRQRPDLIDQALVATDLTGRGRSRVGSLSGGMLRRLLLAQAVLGEPELLVLDEPTAGLDPEQRVRVRELIGRTRPDCATVVSSHLIEDLVPVARRVLMLDGGQLVFDGSIDELGARGAGLVAAGSGLSAHEAAFLSLLSERVAT
ncbi:ABC transporter ATP-binding protein [Nocardioides marmoriginsengisoli]|uniref:ABC transporter ATP-binding protein n=1 Tax=Nocardioides marmoriginsengisoli TaxID=661483 RepID=UPI00161AC894|nr:ATP-binding cassette domain-containing protein [Nocardioides marmoriginsengisoli]